MRTRLGATGLDVTRIGLGLAAVGRPAYITTTRGDDLPADRSVAALRRRTRDLLDHAWDAGIRYVDVARSYGRAEEFLGGWLTDHPDRRPTVGSKWGYTYVGDWKVDADVHEVKDHSLGAFERQLPETRRHLGGALDLYQIHSATLDTGVLDDEDVLAALDDLAAAGVTIGLSLSGPHQAATLERALEVAADRGGPFRCVQATWNVLEPSAGRALAAASDAGWGVIVKEAVANGRLTPAGDPPAAVRDIADRHGVTPDAVAIAAALARPWCDVVLSGAVTDAHLDQNLAALDVSLDDDDRQRLDELAEDPVEYWGLRSERAWT